VKKLISLLAATTVGTLAVPPAWSQAYPARPIRLIVGFPAGGGSDIIARKLAERLGPRMGQAVVVENRPGAGAAIAAQTVVQADPDGYTLYSAGGSMTAFRIFNREFTFDVRTALAPVGKFAEAVPALFTNAKTPAKTLPEFFAYAKSHPGQLNFGSPGGTQRLAMERLRMVEGVDMVHVQYKGSADYVVGLLSDQVQLIIDNPATQVSNMETGKVRILAVTGKSRLPTLPNVPTADESGARGWSFVNWSGVLAPARTPRPVIERLAQDIKAVATSEEFKSDTLKWSSGAYQAAWSTPEEFGQQIASDMKEWEDIAKVVKVDQ
jgi:tripartite-type tricarboxylate transporter receptor subunit TctC